MKDSVHHRRGASGAHPAAPSGRGFIALLEPSLSTGGTAPGEIVCRLLEEHGSGNAISVAQLIYTGQVFGFECLEGDAEAVIRAAQSLPAVDECPPARRPRLHEAIAQV